MTRRKFIITITLLALFASLLAPALAMAQSVPCHPPASNPLVAVIEDEFGIAFEDIEFWYCQNVSLATIIQVLMYAEQTGQNYEDILTAFLSGSLWLEDISQVSTLHPGSVVSGQ